MADRNKTVMIAIMLPFVIELGSYPLPYDKNKDSKGRSRLSLFADGVTINYKKPKKHNRN